MWGAVRLATRIWFIIVKVHLHHHPKALYVYCPSRQPVNHTEVVLSVAGDTQLNFAKSSEHCSQYVKSEFHDSRTQRIIPDSNTATRESSQDTGGSQEHCAQTPKSEFRNARTQRISTDSPLDVLDTGNIARSQLLQSLMVRAHKDSIREGTH